MRVNLSFSEDEYKQIAAEAGRERISSYCRRVVLEHLASVELTLEETPRRAAAEVAAEFLNRNAPGIREQVNKAIEELPNLKLERKNAKPIFKRPGRLL